MFGTCVVSTSSVRRKAELGTVESDQPAAEHGGVAWQRPAALVPGLGSASDGLISWAPGLGAANDEARHGAARDRGAVGDGGAAGDGGSSTLEWGATRDAGATRDGGGAAE
jgi:hypothetical protein